MKRESKMQESTTSSIPRKTSFRDTLSISNSGLKRWCRSGRWTVRITFPFVCFYWPIYSFCYLISFLLSDMLRTTQCLIKRLRPTLFKNQVRYVSNLEDFSIYDVCDSFLFLYRSRKPKEPISKNWMKKVFLWMETIIEVVSWHSMI